MLRGEKRRRTLPHDGESDSALLVAAVIGAMPHLRAPHHRVAVPALQVRSPPSPPHTISLTNKI
jgi:hypothetical protein